MSLLALTFVFFVSGSWFYIFGVDSISKYLLCRFAYRIYFEDLQAFVYFFFLKDFNKQHDHCRQHCVRCALWTVTEQTKLKI